MLACAIGDCNIDVFIRVVEATGKGNYFKVLYIHVLMDLPNGDLVAAGAIYCAVKRAVCSMALSMKFNNDRKSSCRVIQLIDKFKHLELESWVI